MISRPFRNAQHAAEISREAPFQVPIDIPEGFKVDSAEASAAVTWSTDNVSCISEPCLIQTGPEPEDIGVRYAVSSQHIEHRYLLVPAQSGLSKAH